MSAWISIALARSAARKRLIDSLERNRAFSAEEAIHLTQGDLIDSEELERLMDAFVIMTTPQGDKHYLSRERYSAFLAAEKKVTLMTLACVALLGLALGMVIALR